MRKNITVPIYDRRVALFDSIDEAAAFFKDRSGEDLPVYSLDGIVGEAKGRLFIAIERKHATPNTVAHEAVHCAWAILYGAGVGVDAENDEALAYLVGWLVERWNKVMA